MSRTLKRVQRSLSQATRVRITPISPVTLTELRELVTATEDMPGNSRVYASELIVASHEAKDTYSFRGLTIVDTVTEEVAPS